MEENKVKVGRKVTSSLTDSQYCSLKLQGSELLSYESKETIMISYLTRTPGLSTGYQHLSTDINQKGCYYTACLVMVNSGKTLN